MTWGNEQSSGNHDTEGRSAESTYVLARVWPKMLLLLRGWAPSGILAEGQPHAVDRSPGHVRGAGRAPSAHPDHGVLRVERRCGVRDDRRALSGAGLGLAAGGQ